MDNRTLLFRLVLIIICALIYLRTEQKKGCIIAPILIGRNVFIGREPDGKWMANITRPSTRARHLPSRNLGICG
jgi:hypothetical protein